MVFNAFPINSYGFSKEMVQMQKNLFGQQAGVENVQYARTKKERGRKRTCGPQCKVCLTPLARSLPRGLLVEHRFRCRSALDSSFL